MVEADPKWERRGNDLYTRLSVNVLEAMIGCNKEIECIDGQKLTLNLRPGIQPGAEFSSGGRGFRDINSGRPGSLFVIIEVEIPSVSDATLKKELEKMYARISSVS
jgi:molecular chaperone DnaJ